MMMKIYTLLFVVLFCSFAIGQNDYSRLKTSIEKKVSHTQNKDALTHINANYHHLNPILKTEVKVIKMKILNALTR